MIQQLGQAAAHVSTHDGVDSSKRIMFGRRDRNSYSQCRSKDDLTTR